MGALAVNNVGVETVSTPIYAIYASPRDMIRIGSYIVKYDFYRVETTPIIEIIDDRMQGFIDCKQLIPLNDWLKLCVSKGWALHAMKAIVVPVAQEAWTMVQDNKRENRIFKTS